MTKKRERFVDEYLVDLNATQAAIRAGFSAKTAYSQGQRLLKDVEVAAEIEKRQQKRAERTQINQDYVLTRLVENVERAMQAEPVKDREGKETGEYVYQGQVANRALELIGKHIGMFTDRVDLTVNDKRKAAEELAGILGVPVDQLPMPVPALPS